MAVRTREDIIKAVTDYIGERDDDASISLLEDISDSFVEPDSDTEDWKTKYEENDAEWRRRYKERFLGVPSDDPVVEEVTTEDAEDKEIHTYEDLFRKE